MYEYRKTNANVSQYTLKKTNHLNPKESIAERGRDVRIAVKSLDSRNKILQRKETAEYLNPVSSGCARHHIIPDDILKSFIAKVREKEPDVFKNLIRAVEKSYIDYHGISEDEIKNMNSLNLSCIKRLDNNPRNKFLVLITYTKNEEHEDYLNDMQKAFVWSPGNLVIGPTNRKADPGNEFDREAAEIAGIPLGTPRNVSADEEPTGQFRLAEVLSMMENYIADDDYSLPMNIVCDILIPHIKRKIADGSKAVWK